MLIRAMRRTDWPEVADIYCQGIATGDATFETEVPSWTEFDSSRNPVLRLVATGGRDVLGWAAALPVSSRPVYRGVVEHSVYVADAARGRGVGRALLTTLVDLAERCGVWTLRSGIFPENAASLALHAQCGFREVGRHRRLGFGNGRWRDVVLVERRALGLGDARPFLRAVAPVAGPDVARTVAMLRAAGLPPDGLSDCWLLLVADEAVTGGALVGAAALERHLDESGAAYLFRSVVVDPTVRKGGLGRRLVARALDVADAAEGGRARVVLLTITDDAAQFVSAMGFRRAHRVELPAALGESAQLRGACPDTASAWVRG